MLIYLLLKTIGDDGSDITGCLLALSAAGLSNILKLDKAADAASDEHLCFSGMSFTLDDFNQPGGELEGVSVFWITDQNWQDKFKLGDEDSHAFVSRRQFERLKTGGDPAYYVGTTRLVFNQFGDCFFEGSYEDAHGCEESAMLPLADIRAKFQSGRIPRSSANATTTPEPPPS